MREARFVSNCGGVDGLFQGANKWPASSLMACLGCRNIVTHVRLFKDTTRVQKVSYHQLIARRAYEGRELTPQRMLYQTNCNLITPLTDPI